MHCWSHGPLAALLRGPAWSADRAEHGADVRDDRPTDRDDGEGAEEAGTEAIGSRPGPPVRRRSWRAPRPARPRYWGSGTAGCAACRPIDEPDTPVRRQGQRPAAQAEATRTLADHPVHPGPGAAARPYRPARFARSPGNDQPANLPLSCSPRALARTPSRPPVHLLSPDSRKPVSSGLMCCPRARTPPAGLVRPPRRRIRPPWRRCVEGRYR